MSLINSTRDILRLGLKEGMKYRAVVVDNDDPKKLCRIKFKIPNFFEFETKDLPWAISQDNGADGASSSAGVVNIPRIGSYVDIRFTGGSVYHPVYEATSVYANCRLERSNINYPNRKITQLSNGCYLVIDEQDGFIDIFNPGDLRLTINGSSNLITKGVCNIVSDGNCNITSTKGNIAVKAESGSINVTASGAVTVKSSDSATVNAPSIKLVGSSGEGDLAGVVTAACICAFTNAPHSDFSQEVFATTGG